MESGGNMTITAIVSHDIKDWDTFKEGFDAQTLLFGGLDQAGNSLLKHIFYFSSQKI